jgi:hypothetical protein
MNYLTLDNSDKLAALEQALKAAETNYYLALVFQGTHDENVREGIERAQGEYLRLKALPDDQAQLELALDVEPAPTTANPLGILCGHCDRAYPCPEHPHAPGRIDG